MKQGLGGVDHGGAASSARQAGAGPLAGALRAARDDTLALFRAQADALPGLQVPLHPWLNPPLWELGHVGWFQEYWIARNPQRGLGIEADPLVPRPAGVRPGADALYDSGKVPHDTRWHLPLPDAAATVDDLRRQLERTLALLADAAPDDAGLYFFRLALLHEDMHHEAGLYMAQALDVPVADARWQARPIGPAAPMAGAGGECRLGGGGSGFAFDNELGPHLVDLRPFEIDSRVVRWAEFLPFVESGGHAERRWWTEEGWRWRTAQRGAAPRYLARRGSRWEQRWFGRWRALDPALPASHLSCHEAEAWCRWAGRRLPTEAEWASMAAGPAGGFEWGEVWEWTASAFGPYPGFRAHPYRDYSAPWFDGRPVLKGASFATQPRLRDPRYRNFFVKDRNDIFAGFRSCAV